MPPTLPFFTLEDPRARIKGSRDPLGLVAIWYGFGRRLVSNLTTVTDSVRGFSTVLLGRYLGERLFNEEKIQDEDILPVFLRTEQVVAYVRHVGNGVSGDIRGIERVKRNVADARRAGVQIGTRPGETILSDQKTYGLWGLYTASSRVSGLVKDGPVGLTPEAHEFVKTAYEPLLTRIDTRLSRLVRDGGKLALQPDDPVFKAMAGVMREPVPALEASFWAEWLRDARHVDGTVPGRQALLVELLRDRTDLRAQIDRSQLATVAAAARKHDDRLAQAVSDVLDLEALLVPAELAFRLMLARNHSPLSEVANTLSDLWGSSIPHLDAKRIAELAPRISKSQGSDTALVLQRTADAFSAAAYDEVVVALLDWNRLVMDGRKSAPWAVRNPRGRLDVRFEEGGRRLPNGDQLGSTWHNSYFVNSLKRITSQLEGQR